MKKHETGALGSRTFKHVLDEDAALGNLLLDDELLVIRSDEENHGDYRSR